MKKSLKICCMLLLSVLVMAQENLSKVQPLSVTGVVLDSASGRPMAGVHVYTRLGEEEGFTNSNGGFRFASWEQLPVVVTVRDPGGAERRVKVSAAPVKLTVYLP